MRVIAGSARSLKLIAPEGDDTRPTLDRVKESMFNIIQGEIQDSIVLDLFSGCGAIGLEFASRGANRVVLCDNSKEACNIIKKNIEKTHLNSKVELYNMDFKGCISTIATKEFDIIFLDPPYASKYVYEALKEMQKTKIIKEETLIIIETDEEERIENEIKDLEFQIIDKRKYGRAAILILKKSKELS